MAILTLKGLSYDYITKAGRVHALKEATASFEKGVVYAIVGRSGSGKSTLMSLMAGLDVQKDGDIFYGEDSLRTMDRDRYRREHIGILTGGLTSSAAGITSALIFGLIAALIFKSSPKKL